MTTHETLAAQIERAGLAGPLGVAVLQAAAHAGVLHVSVALGVPVRHTGQPTRDRLLAACAAVARRPCPPRLVVSLAAQLLAQALEMIGDDDGRT